MRRSLLGNHKTTVFSANDAFVPGPCSTCPAGGGAPADNCRLLAMESIHGTPKTPLQQESGRRPLPVSHELRIVRELIKSHTGCQARQVAIHVLMLGAVVAWSQLIEDAPYGFCRSQYSIGFRHSMAKRAFRSGVEVALEINSQSATFPQ